MGKVPSAALGLSVLLLILTPALRGTASAGTTDPGPSGGARPQESSGWLVDVPYVSQTKALCGGAAAAMVLRYWGERGVYAEDFADFVDPDEEGIPTAALTEAIRKRGWWAEALRGSPELAQSQLARGRPLVVLLDERPGDYHYVGLIGWLPGRVVVHDPARAPYRLLDERDFHSAWAATGFWTLLILPPAHERHEEEVGPDAPASEASGAAECSGVVQEAVRVAGEGNLSAAEELLVVSAEFCPAAAAPLRELAGIRFRQSRWDEAADLAQRAVALDRTDAHAWRTLAASRFLEQDADGALRAWNEVDELRVDLLRVDGLTRTRYEVVARTLDLPEGELLTSERLALARRRLATLPFETGSRVSYRPVQGGLAQVEASLVERPWLGDRTAIVAAAMDAAIERELSVNVSSPSGGGELWNANWRWWEERPKASVALASPGPWGLPGVWQVEALWERQSYGADLPAEASASTDSLVREERRRAGLTVSDWRTPDSRWELQGGLDHWEDRGRYVFAGGGLEERLASDRAAVRVDTAGWLGLVTSDTLGVASIRSSWRSSASESALVVARGGVEWATSGAPLDLWPGAGTGYARQPLLRAHPLLEDGVVRGDAFGRTLAHGGIETHTWLQTIGIARFGLALFADVGKAWKPLSNEAAPLHVDVGTGLRLKLIGERRTLRVDAAWGLRDGEFALSVGWVLPWPGWR